MLRLIFLFLAAPGVSSAGDTLSLDWSFGQTLVLDPSGTRVTLTITNNGPDFPVCGILSLLDLGAPDPISRVRFFPVEGDCFGGRCLANFSPPPFLALWASVGEYASGEVRQCQFDVFADDRLTNGIQLTGSAGPVNILPPIVPVPAMSKLGIVLMIAVFCVGYLIRERRAT